MVRAFGRRLGGEHDHSSGAKGGTRLTPQQVELPSDGTFRLPNQF